MRRESPDLESHAQAFRQFGKGIDDKIVNRIGFRVGRTLGAPLIGTAHEDGFESRRLGGV